MKTMKQKSKKVLSVFLAVMMLMSAWVWIAPNEVDAVAAATIKSTNEAALATITGGETSVKNYIYGSFPNEDSFLEDEYKSQVYKNVLYSPACTSETVATSEQTLYSGSIWKNYVTGAWFNATTTLVYDGTVPQTGVLMRITGRYSGVGGNNNARIISGYVASGGNGLEFDSAWHGSDGNPNFNYAYWAYTINSDYTDKAAGWTYDGNEGCAWTKQKTVYYANVLKFKGNESNFGDEYYIDATPTFGFYASNKNADRFARATATTTNHIYVINIIPWNTAISQALAVYSELTKYPEKYTTASVAKYCELATNLLKANANNYITSSSNNVTGWNTAAKAAVSAWNTWHDAGGLKVQKYRVTFKNADGTAVKTNDYDYGTTVNLAELAASVSNTLKQGNEQGHQTYTWGNLSTSHVVTDDVTISESPKAIDAHTYGDYTQGDTTHSRTCSVCGYVQTQAHIKGTGYETKAETCTEDGVMTYDCSTCGKKAIETAVINNITGHDFSGTPVENVTGENGNHWRKCSRCDAYGWSGVENACEDHKWDKNADGKVDAGDAIETKASTCKEAGYEKYTCKVCNATWTKTLPLADHKITATAKKDVTNQCGGDGNEAFWTCSVCKRVWKDAALTEELADTTDADNDGIPDALETKGPDHEFTGAYESVSAGKDGTHHRQCKRFAQCKTYGPEEKHTWGDPAVTDATCLKTGKKVYTCTSGCGQTYEETIEKAAHQMTKIDAVAPKCGKAGNNEYYSCSTCSKYYKDEAGTTLTTVEAEKIAALEHKWTTHHDYDTLKTAATCQSAAVYYNHCDYCKTQLFGSEHPYGNPDKDNGHKFNGDIVDLKNGKHAYKCTVEGCTEYGNETTCNYEITKDVASTCKTAGYTTYVCKDCGYGYSNTKALDPNNHKGEGTKTVGALDAKCHTNGYTGDTHCLGCDAQLEKGKTIEADKTVHPHENMKDYEAKAPTCQTEGYKAYRYCSACGTYEIKKVTVPVKAHSFTKYTTNNNGTHTAICDTCDEAIAAKATDTKDCSGGTATCMKRAVCSTCKAEYGDINENYHVNREFVAKVPSTCQTEGTEAYYKCADCGDALEEIVKIEKLDHKYGDWSQIAGEDKHTRSCTTCNPAVAAVATETADCNGGTAYCNKLAKCKDCKAEYGELDLANHSTEANTLKDAVAATCQKEGFSGNYHYDCCNAIKEAGEETPKLDHSFTELVSRELATCIKEGSVTYKCSTCVETVAEPATNTTVLPINAKNHASTETKTVDYKAATCKDDGYTGDKYYTCCYDETKTAEENKKALKEKGTVIKADGKTHSDITKYDAVPATCQKAGNYAYSYCSTCGTYMMNGENVTKDQIVEAKIAHTFTKYDSNGNGTHTATCDTCKAADGEVAKDTKNCSGGTANCTDLAECSVCKGTYGKVDATTHKTVKNFEKVDSTCQKEGYEAYQYCEACNKNITEMKIISKKAHKFGEWTPVDGKDEHTRSCTACDPAVGTVATETEACKGGTATCKSKAKCSVCGDEYGALNPSNHISDEIVTEARVEATCQKDGWTGREYYKCCYVAGADNTAALKNPGTKLPKVAHKYVEVEGTRVPATCLTKGSVSYECSTCDPAVEAVATKVEVLKEDKNNHASEEILTLNAVEATCSTDGYSGDKYHACCYDINKTTSLIQKGYKIPATGDHKLINPVPEYLVEYTETDGVITGYTKKTVTLTYEEKIAFRHEDDNKWYHVQICEDCGKIVEGACFTYEHTSTCTTTDSCEICAGLCSLVNPKNHAGKLILIPAVPATGNTPGTIAHYKCECGELFFDEARQNQVEDLKDLEIEVTIEHEINEEIPAKPNGDGTHSYTCGHCGEPIVEDCSGGTATCQSKAKCSICGQEYGEIDAKNHITDEVVIVGKKDATCSDSGYTGDAYYKCCYVEGADDNSKALKAKGKEIPNDPSLHVMKLKDNLDGTHTEYCEGCGTYELAPVAHIWVAGNVPETASCTEGYDLGYTCICGATKTEHVDAKGHDYAETVKENPADCTTEGEKIITKTCKVCGATETVTETIAALGHDKRTIKGVPATCSTNGSTDYIYCNRCDTVLQDTTVIPATGCEDKNNDGFCDSCGDYLRINEDGTNCNCICHKKNVFMKLLYKFLNFFWKLFKIEKTCGCGAVQHW